jgi:hypothetical protein
MAKKSKSDKTNDHSDELWIAPRYSLKGPAGDRAWENRRGGIPRNARFLELADIALGLKKPGTHKKKATTVSAHDTRKTEPYSPK